jgi:CheY-like chemotaxis protein
MSLTVTASWKRHSDRTLAGTDSTSHHSESLPRMRTRAAQLPHAGETALARGPVRILIVDSDIGAAETLENMLHASGFSETSVAYSGHAAIAIAAGFQPDVVLIDLSVYDMTPYELARSLREQAQSTDIRLIALTFSHEHTAREQARIAGFERYLLRPVAAADLSELLDPEHRVRQGPIGA